MQLSPNNITTTLLSLKIPKLKNRTNHNITRRAYGEKTEEVEAAKLQALLVIGFSCNNLVPFPQTSNFTKGRSKGQDGRVLSPFTLSEEESARPSSPSSAHRLSGVVHFRVPPGQS